jgi:pathogenesis-related protein 1
MNSLMRLTATFLTLAVPDVARAQGPWGYQPYPPGYPPYSPEYRPYGGPVTPPAADRSPGSLARAMLDAHNAVRARVGVPPLEWSPQLAAVAQSWANQLIATRRFAHSQNGRYGENLYTISGSAASPAQVVAAWADEARGYNVATNSCAGVCGHYTQVVWRATRSVGCAVAGEPGREVWVCEYDPPGNVVGYRPY